jgi:hypothetical protein
MFKQIGLVKTSLAALALGVCIGVAQGAVVIGTWEQATDGWIDWGAGQASIGTLPAKYAYVTGVGVTHGSYALELTHAGWNQNLSIKLQNVGLTGAFLANTQLLIDLTVPATDTSGWSKIEAIALNAQGTSWGTYQVNEPAFFGWGEGGGGAQSTTLVFDYSGYINDIVPTLDLGAGQPWWVELIITTNNDGVHTKFIFDNARLVPEPASFALLGLAGLFLMPRRSR